MRLIINNPMTTICKQISSLGNPVPASKAKEMNMGSIASSAPAGEGMPTKYPLATSLTSSDLVATLNLASRTTQQTENTRTEIQPALLMS